MKPNLTRPLIVFDLEATGLDIAKSHIIQISYIKIHLDGREETGNEFINPGIEIPAFITELTSITNEMVADKPTFKEIAPKLAEKFQDCDFAGYNSSNYDIPLLCEEFLRAGIPFDFSKVRLIDVCSIFKNMERRNLAAAYKFYCGRKMEDDFQAHLADQDTAATWAVLQGQLDMYSPDRQEDEEKRIPNDMDSILKAGSSRNQPVDFAGRLIYNDEGEKIINFGKYKGEKAKDVLARDHGYYGWVMQADFTLNTKMEFQKIMAEL